MPQATAHPDVDAPGRAERVPERTAFRALILAALLILAAALALALLPRGCAELRGIEDPLPGAPAFLGDLERQPRQLLPSSVTMFETLTHQEVPGTPHAAEAVYLTYDMTVQAHRPTTSYARVEAFPSRQDAEARVTEIMADYPVEQQRTLLGTATPATVGYSADEGTWIAAWTSGQFAIYLKVFFDGPLPEDKGTVLSDQGMHLSRAVDLYQRTGTQGVGALEILQREGDVFVPDPEAELGALGEIEE